MLTDKPAEPPSLTRTFEKTADQKIIDLNFKALTFIAGLFYKPLATASDPFLRNDLGERYFTSTSAWFGGALWLAAAVASLKISVVPVILLFFNAPRLASWAIEHYVGAWVGGPVFLFFIIRAACNLDSAATRQCTGVPWHSMSRGESIFGNENSRHESIVVLVSAIILLVFAPIAGVLFLVSRVLSAHLIALEQQSIYNRYLDFMDAKILNEYLEPSLRDGIPPKAADGIYGPLPGHFQGEHRANVARVATGSGVPVRVAVRPMQTPPASGDPTSSVPISSNPIVAQSHIEASCSNPAPSSFSRFINRVIPSHNVRRIAAVTLIIGVTIWLGWSGILNAIAVAHGQ